MEQLSNMTLQDILDESLVLITSRGEKQPDKDTKIDPELIKLILQDLESRHRPGRRPCYYDPETNTIRNGINFRPPVK